MYEIIFTEAYEKKAREFFKVHKDLIKRYEKLLTLLRENPQHPSLRLHKLKGDLKEFYSLSISKKFRIIVRFIIEEKKIIMIDIGIHDDVY